MPDPALRGWGELSVAEKEEIEANYTTMTNVEIIAKWRVNRQALTRAARGFAEEHRFKTAATRRRAYADRTRSVLEQGAAEEIGAEAEPDPAEEVDAHRIQAELKELRRVRRAKLDSDVWTKTVIEALRAELPRIAPTPHHPPPYDGEPTRELGLVLSDIQLGSHVDEKEMGGLSAYSWEHFLSRLRRLEEQIVQIKESRGGEEIQRLSVFGLGDYGDGNAIFASHPWALEHHVAYQNTQGPLELSGFLVRLLEHFETVSFTSVYGNHGRVGDKGADPHVQASWDYIFVKFLEIMTENQLGPDERRRIRFAYAESWWMLVERLGVRFLSIHGQQVRAWNQLPYYGLERARQRYVNLIQQHLPPSSGPVTFDVLLCGHHHTPAFIETSSGPILLNGCWPGGSKFSAEVMQAASPPAQWVFEITEGLGLSGLWNVQLAPGEHREVSIVRD